MMPSTTTASSKASPAAVALRSLGDSNHQRRRRNSNSQQPSPSPLSCSDSRFISIEEQGNNLIEEPSLMVMVVVDEPGDDGQSIITIPIAAAMTCPSLRRNTSHCSCTGGDCPQQSNSRRTGRRSTLATASCWMLFFASTFCWVYQTSSSHSRAAASFQPHRHPLSHQHATAPAAVATTAAAAVVEPPTLSTTKLERRLLAAASPRTTSNELRYLTFGSSITWGVGLEEPTASAYPYLLSPLVHNAGMKNNNNNVGGSNNSNGAVLAAACTQSIVQDGVYDVVVLEYSIVDEAVVLLAQRLRQRFPHTTLILLRLQGDASSTLSSSSSTRQQLPAGLDAHVLDLTSLTSSSTLFQSNINTDPSSSLQEQGNAVALSLSSAHADVARAIRALVESLHVTRHVDDDDHVLGDWNNGGVGGDYCNLWYDNGAFMETSSTRRLRPVEFTPLPPQQETESTSSWTSLFFQDDEDIHKHALELDTSSSSSSSGSTSSIRIQNPFSTPRMLYLSYLTTSTELDNDDATPGGTSLIYPHLRVRINGKPSVLLESWHSMAGHVHGEVIRTSAVGVVPGNGVESMIEFHALPGQHAQRPFRLLGASFLPDAVAERLDLEYSLLQAN